MIYKGGRKMDKINKIQYIENQIDNLGKIHNKLVKKGLLNESESETISYLMFLLLRRKNKLFHYYYDNYIQYGIYELIKNYFFEGDEILIDNAFEEIHVKTNKTPLENIEKYQKTIIDGVTIYHKYNL